MVHIAVLLWMSGWFWTAPAAAADSGRGAHMTRVMACDGPQAKMEVYLPWSVVGGKAPLAQALAKPVIGYYALDLSSVGKGKPLEPVKVSMTSDGATIMIDQYTRSLPPTKVPMKGGVVDFDNRFGSAATCGPFDTHGSAQAN